MSNIKKTEEKMKVALDHLRDELKKVRTGKASPAMVEDLGIEVYGTHMKLRDVASINTPEPRQILITPYDASNASAIGKSIERANLGFMPIVDGNAVRINIPSMDASIRKKMVETCHKKREEYKISIRNIRRDSNELARKEKTEGEISEDLLKKLEKEIQDLTDKYCKKGDDLSAEKEKEVSTI